MNQVTLTSLIALRDTDFLRWAVKAVRTAMSLGLANFCVQPAHMP
jgi:hypothetical protein